LDGADLLSVKHWSEPLGRSDERFHASSSLFHHHLRPSQAQKQSDAIIDTQCLSSRFSEIE
ncbi:MAG: hypothetical protein JSW35_03990, partial [Deltaproteobacteria bacterium]